MPRRKGFVSPGLGEKPLNAELTSASCPQPRKEGCQQTLIIREMSLGKETKTEEARGAATGFCSPSTA